MKVLIAGATGLVGNELLKLLENDETIEKIYVLARAGLVANKDNVDVIISDFDDLDEVLQRLEQVEVVFSCLGTTKAKTKSKRQYEKIEIDYPTQIANWGAKNGLQQFHYISCVGANIQSKNDYLNRKGIAEHNIGMAGIPKVYFYRPSLITGQRVEPRFMERISSKIMNVMQPLLRGKAQKYAPIDAHALAAAMWHQMKLAQEGNHYLHFNDFLS